MKRNSLSEVALLWDESFLWGVMARKALIANGLSFDLIRSDDVRNGRLREYSLLFVPGGWASNKVKRLGDAGVEEIKRFVREGGSYLGFCGGAGLATMDGIGLLPVKRRPTRERVPSFSGPIRLDISGHPLWQGIVEPVFHAWWPSQFVTDETVAILATYGEALPGAYSSDVNVGDADANGGWAGLESSYRINLDPKRLLGEPAVVEGKFGKGNVLLSLVHFDTLDDRNGSIVLKNLWRYLTPDNECELPASDHLLRSEENRELKEHSQMRSEGILEVEESVSSLIDLGVRNFLWHWRNPLLLQWRRGVRGLEYGTLYIMVKEISELIGRQGWKAEASGIDKRLYRVKEFADRAKHLLIRERFAMQNAHITYERCDDPEIQSLREVLFSQSKSHGGLFKEVLDELDELLYNAMITAGAKDA